ncbi:MAG: LexA family protein [Candidatus Levyibacteriota bacterium]
MDKALIITRLKYFYASNKRMPTYGEMCKLLKYKSKGAVRYAVQKLIEDDVIAKDENGQLIPKTLLQIPMLGVIKAGYPMPAELQVEQFLNLHLLFDQMSDASYALTVSGDSMIDAGIYEGDIVIIDKEREPIPGDIVAACVDGEWTVKTLRREDNGISLHPANKKYPVIYPTQSLEIGGVVVHVMRSYR